MPKPYNNPYGYKKLLAYKKAEELQKECRNLTANFPRTKTMIDLADQMDRSSRSGKQNIVEGWRRNSTKEYNDFLGFSIGAVAELEEDCRDIWRGVYPELLEKREIMGERGEKGEKGEKREMGEKGLDIEKLRFYPLDRTFPKVVQLKLRCRELIYLLEKLQKSLESKMITEGTLSQRDIKAKMVQRRKQADLDYKKFLEQQGMVELKNGKVAKKEELEE
jgi:four helix bundle protein